MQSRACPGCGKSTARARERGASLEARVGGWLRGVPGERSGLAYASGFAAVFYLFRFSLAPLAVSGAWLLADIAAALLVVTSLLAPLALVLSFAAGAALDGSPQKSGALPTLFGYTVGMWGTVGLLVLRDPVWTLVAHTQ